MASASRSAFQSDAFSHGLKYPKTSQFSVIRRSTGVDSHTAESYYRSFQVATSCVNRCASRICHIQLSRKKLRASHLYMISTAFSSLLTHYTVLEDTGSEYSVIPRSAVVKRKEVWFPYHGRGVVGADHSEHGYQGRRRQAELQCDGDTHFSGDCRHLDSLRDKFHLHDFSHIGKELLEMGKQP
jgi:hypothetical protein